LIHIVYEIVLDELNQLLEKKNNKKPLIFLGIHGTPQKHFILWFDRTIDEGKKKIGLLKHYNNAIENFNETK
jgi:hypothetical protein